MLTASRFQHKPVTGTPISILTYVGTQGQTIADNQIVGAYYQENSDAVQELNYKGALNGWQTSKPIFTDAKKFTGLATFTRFNGTQQNVGGILSSSRFPTGC